MRTSIIGLTLLALSAALPACAHSRSPYGTADTALELERVVLYRNGVGYFERTGEVDEDVLRIKVRRDQVNDLLKSLTVIHAGSGQAVSISMPLDPQSWAGAALASLEPGNGSLAEVLDGLRGTEVALQTTIGRVRGRIVMVEELENEPDPDDRARYGSGAPTHTEPTYDHRVTVVEGGQMRMVRLSKVRGVTLKDGDLALQLNRRLDASAGEGMFQQIEVAIHLVGAKKHDLMVSYVVAAPMWKPTYRVVLPDSGKGSATLQGWAVVDNTSGEDWSKVKLSLTSGEPIAFEYDLHTPRTVGRANLTESGVRRRARVAVGETTVDFDDAEADETVLLTEEEEPDAQEYKVAANDAIDSRARKPSAPKAKKRASRRDKDDAKGSGRGGGPGGGDDYAYGASAGEAKPSASPAAPPSPEPVAQMDYDGLRRSTQATARAQKVAGMTRFDIAERVTVPNGSSTMVAILNQQVDAEETFLFRPGGAGYGYDQNPYRVVRFKNASEFVLEPGPISIYAGNSFVGEGLSEAVGTNTSATIPFAVEPSIAVTSKQERNGDEMRLVRIVRGVLEVESFARSETTWTARGPRKKEAWSVLVRHPKAGWNYELLDRPPETEDLPDGYLVRVNVAANASEGELKVVEQTPSRTTISIWDGRSVKLLQELLIAADVTPQMRKRLEPVVTARQEIGRIDTQITGLKKQQVELDQRANQTRSNLEAIKKDAAANALRKKLSKRLEEFTSQGDAIGRKIVELQSARLEKKIELEDLLQNLDVRAPTDDKAEPKSKK